MTIQVLSIISLEAIYLFSIKIDTTYNLWFEVYLTNISFLTRYSKIVAL